jgi:hypothetical protein
MSYYPELIEKDGYKVLPYLPDGPHMLNYDVAEVLLRVNNIDIKVVDITAGRFLKFKPLNKSTLLFRKLQDLVDLHGGGYDERRKVFVMPSHKRYRLK